MTRDDIIACFIELLGRAPESEDVINSLLKEATLPDVLRMIVGSPEYADRLKTGSPLYHVNTSLDLIQIIRNYEKKDRQPVAGHLVNFLGVAVDTAFSPAITDYAGQVEGLPIPGNWHADIAEWGAVLRAVDLATDSFCVVELGCGWGCWITNSLTAARAKHMKQLRGIGVEADIGHVAFARQAFVSNRFTPEMTSVIHGVAAPHAGTALFPRQEAAGHDWGLQPVFDPVKVRDLLDKPDSGFDPVALIPLQNILASAAHVDLLHVDIQGGEHELFKNCITDITAVVRYVVIGTHSREIEGALFEVMQSAGWVIEVERPAIMEVTRNGWKVTIDGVQGWRNPSTLET